MRPAIGSALLALGFVSFIPPATLQAQQPDITFRGDVELRQIEVRVTAKRGRPVLGLTSEDFALFEKGVRQEDLAVDYIPEPPRAPELSARKARTESASEGETDRLEPLPPLWVFVVTQASSEDFGNVLRGMERFVRKEIRQGMRVSIGGLPFTADRVQMLASLEQMRSSPFGQGPDHNGNWLPPTIDITEPSLRSMESERETAADPRTEPALARRPNARLTTDYDQQIDGYYRLMLENYLSLIRELRPLPGKKVVVLFRGGLRADINNMDVLERITGESVRSRVSFYTADSRGALPILPVADGFSERRVERLKGRTGRGGGGRESLSEERQDRFSQSQQGLYQLAAMTGGRSVLNSNDLSLVFTELAKDAGGYYLVSYSPERSPNDTDVRRTVEVQLSRDGLKVRYPSIYYDQ